MRISVIIPTFNRKDRIVELLEALAMGRPPEGIELEIIVADDRSSDGTSELVRSRFPAVRLVEGKGKSSRLAKRAGIEASTGDYIVFLDDDMIPREDWIVPVAEAIGRGEALIQSKIIFHDLGQQELQDESPQFCRTGFQWNMIPIAVLNGAFKPRYIDMCQEAGLFIKRSLLKSIPFDDPNLRTDFGEAASFYMRAEEADYKVYFEPRILLDHWGAEAGGCKERDQKSIPRRNCTPQVAGMVHNFILFARQRNPGRVPLLIPYYLAAGVYLSARQRKNCLKWFADGVWTGLRHRWIPTVPYQNV